MCNPIDRARPGRRSRKSNWIGGLFVVSALFPLPALLPTYAAAQIARDSVNWTAADDSGDIVTAKAIFELREIDPGGDSYYEFGFAFPPAKLSHRPTPSVYIAWNGEGAITVAVDDRLGYFADLPLGSGAGPGRQALYAEYTGGTVVRHAPPDTSAAAMAFMKLMLGTASGGLGAAFGMLDVLAALGGAGTPSFGMTTMGWSFQEWSDTHDANVQNAYILLTAEPEAPFTDDRVYDTQTYAWSKFENGWRGEVQRFIYRFALGKDSAGPSELYLRALIPYRWKKTWGRVPKDRYLEIEWRVPLDGESDVAEDEVAEDDVAEGEVAIGWAGEVASLINVTNPGSNLLGPPDDRIVGLAGRAGSEVTAAGFGETVGGKKAVTSHDAARLAAALGVSAHDLARADFFALEYNGSPRTPFESSHWVFDDGASTCTISHDFNRPEAGEAGIVKAGTVSHADVNQLFGIKARSGSYAYLLFDVSSLGVDPHSSALRVTITGAGATNVGTPDPDALGVLWTGSDQADERGDTPAVSIAAPTQLEALFPAGVLRLEWVDNAVGETGVRIRVYRQGAPEPVGELPANATSWVSQYSLTTGREYTLDVCAFRETTMGGEEVACSAPVTFLYQG